ncbi:MAG: VOC family protein [Pseudonocardia sp.]
MAEGVADLGLVQLTGSDLLLPSDLVDEFTDFTAPSEPTYALVSWIDGIHLLQRDLGRLLDPACPGRNGRRRRLVLRHRLFPFVQCSNISSVVGCAQSSAELCGGNDSVAGELSFFSIGVGDVDKARAFYGALFGWGFGEPPAGKGAVIETSNVPGGIHGGDPGASPYLFFVVDDIDAAATQVRELGGTIETLEGEEDHEDRTSTAKFGRFRLCRDDQGSSFGLHQPPSVTSPPP